MVKYLVVRVVGAMIFAGASVAGYALDITQATNIGYKWWPLIALGFSVVLVAWVISDLYKVNARLLDARPSINVAPFKEVKNYYLKIHNNGAEAVFKAQIMLNSKDPSTYPKYPSSQYDACWESPEKYEAKILKGDSCKITIAEVVSTDLLGGPSSSHLRIFCYDQSTQQPNYVRTSSHRCGAYIEHPDSSTMPMTTYEYKLCVTISSSPELKEGIFHGDYTLDINGLRIDPNSQLTSHKEGCQN